MFLKIFFWLALIDGINGQVLTVYVKANTYKSIACSFDNVTYLSFYKHLKQATTLSIQYICSPIDGLYPNSAVITPLNLSQSSDYQCLYNCSYTEPTITCTRQRKDDNIVLSQTNILPIVSLNDSNPSDTCVPTIWSESSYPYVWIHPTVSLNKSCAPSCDGDNYVHQTKSAQTTEGYITSSTQTLSSSSLTIFPPSTTKGYIAPSVKSSEDIVDTDTKNSLIVGVCLGIVIVILVGIILFLLFKRKTHGKNVPEDDNTDTTDNQQIEISQISMPEQGSYDTLGGYDIQSNSGNLSSKGSYVNTLVINMQESNQYETINKGVIQYKDVYDQVKCNDN